MALLEAVLVIVFVILAGRYLLSPVLRLVAVSRTAEVFTAAALFAVLGTAWLMEEAGLSLALGAFLAGLMMAESSYRHQVVADIQPFRGILLGLFFMAVGMSSRLRVAWQSWRRDCRAGRRTAADQVCHSLGVVPSHGCEFSGCHKGGPAVVAER